MSVVYLVPRATRAELGADELAVDVGHVTARQRRLIRRLYRLYRAAGTPPTRARSHVVGVLTEDVDDVDVLYRPVTRPAT